MGGRIVSQAIFNVMNSECTTAESIGPVLVFAPLAFLYDLDNCFPVNLTSSRLNC